MITWRITPGTRGSSRRPGETSRLAPPRDSDSLFTQWRKLRTTMTQQANHESRQQLARVAAGREMWSWQSDLMHPFKIYRFPIEMTRKLPVADLRKAWRTFRVRGGQVLTTTMLGLVPLGTDGSDFPYQQALFSTADGKAIDQTKVKNIIVPENTIAFYFWIELKADNSEAYLTWGTNPTADHYTDTESVSHPANWSSDNPWTGWPKPDAQHFLLGFVDTRSQLKLHRALPRQFQFTDILASGGGSSCDIYG